MSAREAWITLKATVGSEDARQELREKHPDNPAGRYGDSVGAQAARVSDSKAGQMVQSTGDGGALGRPIGSGEGDYNSYSQGKVGVTRQTAPTNQNRVENFKPIPIRAEDTIQPAPNLKLPSDATELAKRAESLDRPAPNTPHQQSRSNQGQSSESWYDQHLFKGVGQNVEDRLIAHAVTGGLGWKT